MNPFLITWTEQEHRMTDRLKLRQLRRQQWGWVPSYRRLCAILGAAAGNWPITTKRYILLHCINYVILITLSELAPPLWAGYSQSISIPSRPYVEVIDKALWTKAALSADEDATVENLREPSFHPPMANNTLSLGFDFFNATALGRFPKIFYISFEKLVLLFKMGIITQTDFKPSV